MTARIGLPEPLPSGELNFEPSWIICHYSIEPAPDQVVERPLIVLTDGGTCSAAEGLVWLLRPGSEAVFMGGPTAGSVTECHSFELPGGGVGAIGCSRETLRGLRSPCAGFQPDVPVQRAVQGVMEGRDEVLEAAVRLLEEKR